MTTQTQKAVTFYGDTLVAIRQDDTGAIFIPVARLCIMATEIQTLDWANER